MWVHTRPDAAIAFCCDSCCSYTRGLTRQSDSPLTASKPRKGNRASFEGRDSRDCRQ